MKQLFLLGILVLGFNLSIHAQTSDLNSLDSQLLSERLKKTYWRFYWKNIGEWQINLVGQTQNWKWKGNSWVCPKDALLTCDQWVPLSFRWASMGRSFLDQWTPTRKLRFEIGKPKVEAKPVNFIDPEGEPVVLEEENKDEPEIVNPFDQKRWASEVWEFRSNDQKSLVAFISLRNQWIEKFEREDGVKEYLEWSQKTPTSTPRLDRITLERDDQIVTFTRVSS